MTPRARAMFEANVERVTESGCWIWLGQLDPGGYGKFDHGRAHRKAYIEFRGPVPSSQHLDHLCRVRCCVNPDHLESVTPRENTMRSPVAPAAVNARKTHCDKGHPLSGDNLVLRKSNAGPTRGCATCMREYRNTWAKTPAGRACRDADYYRRKHERRKHRPEFVEKRRAQKQRLRAKWRQNPAWVEAERAKQAAAYQRRKAAKAGAP